MPQMPELGALGPRIMIFGMSSSGKSTLTNLLARKINATPVYLDTLYHQAGTAWIARPSEDFQRLHKAAIAGDWWVMDGNYARLMGDRLSRATGVIWINPNRFGCVYRYFKRSFIDQQRHGRLEDAADTFTWPMVKHIMMVQPAGRQRMSGILSASKLPVVRLTAMPELNGLYTAWHLCP